MIYLYIYLTICTIWSLYAVYKTRSFGTLGKLVSNQIQSFIINFLLCPYCIYYAVKYKKFNKSSCNLEDYEKSKIKKE
jgi:hypothetical protein